MPHYEYDKDYPFAAFITNLGKYNEGELVGEWVKFPTTHEELQEVFKRIGIGAKDNFGNPYEEWFITDYDCYVGNLYDKLGEYENLDELNYLASKLDDMDRYEYNQFLAAMEMGDHTGSIQDMINLTENLDCYEVYPDIEDHDDLGRYYIDELDAMQVPEHLCNYIDYEAYGRDIALDEGGEFTEFGYVRDTGDRFVEVYDGDRERIPEEYRVMSSPDGDGLTEDDKLDMATDLAFDLDEFFRQNDPQYAAEFPGEQEQKEALCDAMLEGKFAAIETRLATVSQAAPEDFNTRIEELKEAVGYEEFLDIDPAAVREALQNPDKSHIDEMLAFAEQAEREYVAELNSARAAKPEKMTVLVVEPLKEPYTKEISAGLSALQAEVSGSIQAVYPYDDPVAVICNEEGKLDGLPLNRALRDEDGELYDVVAGTFLVVGLSEENFSSLSPELTEKYTAQFKTPEQFVSINGKITVIPVLEERVASPAPAPDDLTTGERISTPRGSFALTDMTRQQIEAAGYGFHHQSDDGKYLIMGNGPRVFAIRNEDDNPMRTAEMTLEDDYGMIDGVINNGRRGEELEKAKEAAAKSEPERKPSFMDRLADAKKECAERKPADRPSPTKKPPELGEL